MLEKHLLPVFGAMLIEEIRQGLGRVAEVVALDAFRPGGAQGGVRAEDKKQSA